MLRIEITTGNRLPIYRQIADQIRQAIAVGKIATGESVPSVRGLAAELVVNPNTVAKAYSSLVRDGVLDSHQGRGYVVAQRREIYTRKERQRRLEAVMDPFLAEALSLGFDAEQIQTEVGRRLRRMAKVSP